MAVKQVIIVRRGCDVRYRGMQETFGVAPLSAAVVWDRRQSARRVHAGGIRADRRRTDRRGAEPSSWAALDFLVVGAPAPEVARATQSSSS